MLNKIAGSVATLLLCACCLPAQVSIPTAQYSNLRTNANQFETALTPSNVNTASFGKLFSRPVDDSIYATPIYLPNVTIPGEGTHNVVYVVTASNTAYAFDADDPAQSAPLWSRNIGPAPAVTGNVQTHWGTLGTPVINGNTMYFVAYIGADTSHWSMYLCALNVVTGADQYGPPAEILFPLGGTLVPATPYTIQRAGLLVANDRLYIGFADFQQRPPDRASQEGFVFSYSLTDLSQPLARFQTTNGQGGDIWQASRGLAADSHGYIYATTGNGYYDGVLAFGNSVLKFDRDLNLVDWFTPKIWPYLYRGDLDISASGPLLLPGSEQLVAGGKEGVLYLLGQSNLGGLRDGSSTDQIQQFHATDGCHFTNCSQTLNLAFLDRGSDSRLFVWDRHDALRSFSFNGTRLQTSPLAVGPLTSEMIGGITVSANGSIRGTAIVWASTAAAPADYDVVPGTLRAYDADDITHELWNSDTNASRDVLGGFTKFASPVVANGRVYMVGQSNQLQVYGLLP